MGNGFGWDCSISLDVDLSSVLGVLARLGLSHVDIVFLEVLSFLLGINEGAGCQSTIAAFGIGVAINELLLGEGEELSGLDEMLTLYGSGGSESPA